MRRHITTRPARGRALGRVLGALPLAASLSVLAACSDSSVEGGSAGAGTASTEVLRFGAIPDEKGTDLAARFAPVEAYLAEELGVQAEFVPVDSYESLVAQFKNGDVQLAWFGGLTGAQARAAVDGARAIAQGKVDPDFVSYFVANAATGIEPGEDFPMALEGRRFTFGSASSTSGRLMPEYFIRENTGKSPAEFFGMENNYSGGHDKTAKLVEAGTFDAGALNYKVYDQMVADGELDPDVCVKVWTTPTYADYNWTAHPLLEERYGDGFLDRLQDALVGMDSEAILGPMMRPEGLIEASNEDFRAIHDLAVELDLLR